MDYQPTDLAGVTVLTQQRHGDERGWFTRAWCAREHAAAGLDDRAAQVNFSHTARAGTVRGIHRQAAPHAEAKTIWVLAGAVFDVAVDLRADSPTRGRHIGVELSAENGRGLVVPRGFGHGFQALTDGVVMVYVMSEFYAPETERGVRFDDPVLGIPWPREVTVVSDKDRALPPMDRVG